MGTTGLLPGVSFPRDTCELQTKQDPLLELESFRSRDDDNHVDDDVTSTMSESSSGIGGLDRLVPSKTTERQVSGKKALYGHESDVDSGIVSCQLMDNHTASISSSSETDSSRESTSNEQKPRSISDPTQCVRFDEQLHLSEENIRRSCRKLFATLYSNRFSYPCYNNSEILNKACDVGSVSPMKQNTKADEYVFSGRPVPHSRLEMTKISESIPENELQRYRCVMENGFRPKLSCANTNRGRDFSIGENVQKPEYRRSVSNVVYSSSKLISNVREWNSEKTVPVLYSESQMNGTKTSEKNLYRTNTPVSKEDSFHRTPSTDQRFAPMFINRFESQKRAFPHHLNGVPKSLSRNSLYSKPPIHKSLSCTVLSASENVYLSLTPYDKEDPTRPRRTSDPISMSSLNISGSYHNEGLNRTSHDIPRLTHRNSMVRAYARVVPIISDDSNSCASSKLEPKASSLKPPIGTHEGTNILTPVSPNTVPQHSKVSNTKPNTMEIVASGNGVKPGPGITPVHKSSSYKDLNYSKLSDEIKGSNRLQKGRLYVSGRNGSVTRSQPSFLEIKTRECERHRSPSSEAIPNSSRGNVTPYKSFTTLNHLRAYGNRKSRKTEYEVLDQSQKGRFNSLPVLDNLASVDMKDQNLPTNPKRGLHQSDFTLYRNRPSPPSSSTGKSFLDRIQGFTRSAKNAVQKAFSTERIYRPEREERYEAEGQKLKRSRSFIRGLKERMSKKKRKESKKIKKLKPPAAQVVRQERLNTSWDEPVLGPGCVTHVEGQLLQLNPDGSQVIELTKPPSKPYGFFVARGRIRNSRGIFVSRMRDQETEEHLTGLLGIGDEILEIEGLNVKHADILEVNSLMSQRNSLILTVLPYVCRKD